MSPPADDIATKVAAQAQPGSIVRLHLAGPNTLAALPAIVDALAGNGLQPINLGRLLGL